MGVKVRKRTVVFLAMAGLLFGLQAAPAASAGEVPPHGHMLVLGLEFDEHGEPVAFRKCVDLAGGQAVPLRAHHAHIHVGKAGEMLRTKAGNFVVPTAPLTPFNNCADLVAAFGG
jgi:hypothetical protein